MGKITVFFIRLYQKTISPDQSVFREWGLVKTPHCSFYPSCSEYAVLAIEKHGFVKGIIFAVKRILRCHPWQKNHFDPVK